MTVSLHRSVRAILSLFTLTCVLLSGTAHAATYTLAPVAYQTVLDTNGNPVSGAKICTYLAGTTTQAATFSDSIGTPNLNPIRADSSGRFVAYLATGASYKFIFQDATGTAGTCDGVQIRVQDNIPAVPATTVNLDVTGTAGEALTAGQAVYLSDGSGAKAAGQWFKADSANAYSSSTAVSIGMVPTSIVSGAAGTIRLAGQMTGLSSLTLGAAYYVGTAGAITATAPVNARKIGEADTTSSLVIALPQPSLWSTITTTSTGTQNDFAPGLVGNTILRANNATLLTINGIAAGYDGQRLILEGLGGGEIDLASQNVGSAAANRIITVLANSNLVIPAAGGSAELTYDATTARWRVVSLHTATTTGLTVVSGSTTGTVNDWAPGLVGNTTFVMSSASDLTVTGIAGGYAGQTITFVNNGSGGNLFFAHNSGSSLSANRFINAASTGNTPVAAGGWISYTHNGSNWRLVGHEQGSWITPTYAAGSYTASSGTWTVDAGDVTTQAYLLRGRTVTVAFSISTTSTSATPTTLSISNAAWGGYTVAKAILNPIVYNDNAAGNTVGFVQVQAAGTTIPITKLTGTFAIATNTTNVFGEITFEVQ